MNLKFINSASLLAIAILTARGVSMNPVIHEGERLVIDPIQYRDLAAGEIVTYDNYFYGRLPVTHRLVRKTPRGWVTKGDNNDRTDPGLCSEKNLIGIVTLILPAPVTATAAPLSARKDAP